MDELAMVCGPCGCFLQGAVPGSTPQNRVATDTALCKLPLGSQLCPTPPYKTVIPGILSLSQALFHSEKKVSIYSSWL